MEFERYVYCVFAHLYADSYLTYCSYIFIKIEGLYFILVASPPKASRRSVVNFRLISVSISLIYSLHVYVLLRKSYSLFV